MQSYQCADDARDLHKMVDIHMLIITYLIFMFNYHICRACSVATVHTALCLMYILSSQKSEMNLTVASFFEMMKVGAAHLLALIHFNTPKLMSVQLYF